MGKIFLTCERENLQLDKQIFENFSERWKQGFENSFFFVINSETKFMSLEEESFFKIGIFCQFYLTRNG